MEQNLSLGPRGPDHAEQKHEVTQSWGWGLGECLGGQEL